MNYISKIQEKEEMTKLNAVALYEALTGIKPDIKIGEYYISKSYNNNNDKIHINHESGEGGDFSKKDFNKIIEPCFDADNIGVYNKKSLANAVNKFYQENF